MPIFVNRIHRYKTKLKAYSPADEEETHKKYDNKYFFEQ